ncbi:hypothetical protein ACNKHS_23095 [Shigella flexneri]
MDQIDEKINLDGGAIALGHPLGCCRGAYRTALINLMERKDAQFGLATMCIGLGRDRDSIREGLTTCRMRRERLIRSTDPAPM